MLELLVFSKNIFKIEYKLQNYFNLQLFTIYYFTRGDKPQKFKSLAKRD